MNRPEDWTRLERLQYLLDNWSTIFDVNAGSTTGGGDLGLALLPPWANHPSVKELNRCLTLLGEHAPVEYRHLKAYRCGAEWRQVKAKIRVKLPSGRFDTIDGFNRQRIVPAWIRLEKVRRGEQFLADRFVGQVFIPTDLWESAAIAQIAA